MKREEVIKKVNAIVANLPLDFDFYYTVGISKDNDKNLGVKVCIDGMEWAIETADDCTQVILFDAPEEGLAFVPTEVLFIAYELRKAAVMGDFDFVWDYYEENRTDGVGRKTIVS